MTADAGPGTGTGHPMAARLPVAPQCNTVTCGWVIPATQHHDTRRRSGLGRPHATATSVDFNSFHNSRRLFERTSGIS